MNDEYDFEITEFYAPIATTEGLLITSPYGKRGDIFHSGVDFRCYNFNTKRLEPFQATEDFEVVRKGRDGKDNGILAVKPLENTEYNEILYVHINVDDCRYKVGDKIVAGEPVGFSEIRGESAAHHLHFAVEKEGKRINPLIYLDQIGVAYS